jgi:hypothetical protein
MEGIRLLIFFGGVSVEFSNGRLEANPLYSENGSGLVDTKTNRTGLSAVSARFFTGPKLDNTGNVFITSL